MINYHGISLQSVNITGFILDIHRVSLCFLQPFSIDSPGCPCRDPVIPSPCTFHGINIGSVVLSSIGSKKGERIVKYYLFN